MLIHFIKRKGEENGRRKNRIEWGKKCDADSIHTAGGRRI